MQDCRVSKATVDSGDRQVTVTMREDDFRFLQDLAKEIETQDNRATAMPYYYVAKGHRQYAAPEGMGDRTVYVDWEDGPISYYSREEFVKAMEGLGCSDEEIERRWSKISTYGEHDVPVEENVFLTERGFRQHMELNGHNYRHFKEPVYSYVKHAFRNPEMASLIRAVLNIGKAKPDRPFTRWKMFDDAGNEYITNNMYFRAIDALKHEESFYSSNVGKEFKIVPFEE